MKRGWQDQLPITSQAEKNDRVGHHLKYINNSALQSVLSPFHSITGKSLCLGLFLKYKHTAYLQQPITQMLGIVFKIYCIYSHFHSLSNNLRGLKNI